MLVTMPKFQTNLPDELKSHKNNFKGWNLSSLRKNSQFLTKVNVDCSVYSKHKESIVYWTNCCICDTT